MSPAPGTATLTPEDLRSLFLFESLSDGQLAKLAASGHVVSVDSGWLYREGEAATCFYVLLSGAVSLHRRSGGDDLEVGRTRQRGVYSGAWEAYLGDDAPAGYTSSLRVLEPATFFVLPAAKFGRIVREWFPMAVHLLEGLRIGLTEAMQLTGQRDRLLALGSLTAGLTHELGNPAAALARTLHQVQDELGALETAVGRLAPGLPAVPTAGTSPVPDGPLRRSEAEDELLDALEDRDVPDADDLAAVLVEHGFGPADLPADPDAVGWFARTVAVRSLVAEAAAASARIGALLSSAGSYAQLDRAPERWVDVRELLDGAIAMLGAGAGRAVGGSRVVTDYADVPQVLGHTGELTQVWTNLLDNALDALGERGGTVTVRVRPDRPADGVGGACASRSPTTAPASRPRCCPGSSSPSSRRRTSARAPGSASTSPGASSCTATTAGSPSAASRARPSSASGCPSSRPPTAPPRRTDVTEPTDPIDPAAAPSGPGCADCESADPQGWWFHLRRCAACGHVGCCDSSPGQHARAHAAQPGHSVVRSYEPGEEWFYDFATDETYASGPDLAPPLARPADQPAPGPRGRVPWNWTTLLH